MTIVVADAKQLPYLRTAYREMAMIPIRLAALCGTCVWLASSAAVHTTPPRVTIDAGSIVGKSDGRVTTFKGIPYAKAPTDSLRWRAPQPADHWTSDLDATKFGAACPQITTAALAMADGHQSPTHQACLTLNVWAPAHTAAPAPLMVFIHGGANSVGAVAGP